MPLLARAGSLFFRVRRVPAAPRHLYPKKRRGEIRDASDEIERYLAQIDGDAREDPLLLACGLIELRVKGMASDQPVTPSLCVGLLVKLPRWTGHFLPYPARIVRSLLAGAAAPYRGLL